MSKSIQAIVSSSSPGPTQTRCNGVPPCLGWVSLAVAASGWARNNCSSWLKSPASAATRTAAPTPPDWWRLPGRRRELVALCSPSCSSSSLWRLPSGVSASMGCSTVSWSVRVPGRSGVVRVTNSARVVATLDAMTSCSGRSVARGSCLRNAAVTGSTCNGAVLVPLPFPAQMALELGVEASATGEGRDGGACGSPTSSTADLAGTITLSGLSVCVHTKGRCGEVNTNGATLIERPAPVVPTLPGKQGRAQGPAGRRPIQFASVHLHQTNHCRGQCVFEAAACA